MQAETESERDRRKWLIVLALFVLGAVVVILAVLLLSGGGRAPGTAENLQTVRFEEPTEAGEDPFTEPADVEGPETVPVGSGSAPPASGESSVGAGPFGGSGSDLVCDRELLIKSLLAQPDRMRAWAGVLGVEPTRRAVSAYIRSLTPVTLTVDTRVTNHTFVDGRAVPLQSILAAGTAVLVDKYGRPVVRCRCGNPLLEPVFYPKATCVHCPPKYDPPPPCRYRPYRPWYPYPPEYLPPRLRDPYPPGYPKPRYGVRKNGRLCYVVYRRAPKVDYPPRYTPPAPEPEYTITDTYTEPEYEEEPTYTEPDYTITDTYPEPEYTEPQPEPPTEEPYCYEADSPDRFEEGCQGTFGPPPG